MSILLQKDITKVVASSRVSPTSLYFFFTLNAFTLLIYYSIIIIHVLHIQNLRLRDLSNFQGVHNKF